MNFTITGMRKEHIDEVYEIERASFSAPWTKESIINELTNEYAFYAVALLDDRPDGRVAGYCGLWHIVNEGHITNIAVKPEYRRNGVGGALLERLIAFAREKEMIGLTLEVRMNNKPAHSLYARYGFKPEGIRKGYYSDLKEDAIIMWKYF